MKKNNRGASPGDIEKVFTDWEKRFSAKSRKCSICGSIKKHTEDSCESNMGHVTEINTLPEERKNFTLLLMYRNHSVLGCEQCGQLYLFWIEKDNDLYWYGWGEFMQKYHPGDLCRLVLVHRNRDGYEITIQAGAQ